MITIDIIVKDTKGNICFEYPVKDIKIVADAIADATNLSLKELINLCKIDNVLKDLLEVKE